MSIMHILRVSGSGPKPSSAQPTEEGQVLYRGLKLRVSKFGNSAFRKVLQGTSYVDTVGFKRVSSGLAFKACDRLGGFV